MHSGVLSQRFTITPDTIFCSNAKLPFDEIFVVDYGCEIIADEDGNILSIVGANG